MRNKHRGTLAEKNAVHVDRSGERSWHNGKYERGWIMEVDTCVATRSYHFNIYRSHKDHEQDCLIVIAITLDGHLEQRVLSLSMDWVWKPATLGVICEKERGYKVAEGSFYAL